VAVSTHTIYAWKATHRELEVSEAREAKPLRDENTRLNKMVADLMLGEVSAGCYAAVLKSFGIPSQYVRDLPERLWMAAAKLAKFYRLHPMRRGLRPGCRATFNANRGICSFPLHVRQLA
jgi:hypothetical protein